MLERSKLVVLTLHWILISLGVIELCRRLGHEAFGEEDDEASDLSFNRLSYVWEYFKNISNGGYNNSMVAKIYSFQGRGNYTKFCVLAWVQTYGFASINLYLFVFVFRLSTATLSGVEYHFIMQRYYWSDLYYRKYLGCFSLQIVIVIGAWIKCIKVINLKSNHQAHAVVQKVDGPVGWRKRYAILRIAQRVFVLLAYPLFSDLSAGWPYSMDKSFLAGKAIRKTRFPLFCKAGLFICC